MAEQAGDAGTAEDGSCGELVETHPGVLKLAFSPATTMSQLATSWQPAAAASASTCATTGTSMSCSRFITLVHAAKTASWCARPRSVRCSVQQFPK